MKKVELRKMSQKDLKDLPFSSDKCITPVCRLAYVNLLSPRKPKDEEGKEDETKKAKYSVCMIFDTESDFTNMRNLLHATLVKKFGAGYPKKYLEKPFRDGNDRIDEETGKVKPEFKDKIFVNCSTMRKPFVGVKVAGKTHEINDPDLVYSGMYARVAVNTYSYSSQGNKGASFGLFRVLKQADGPKIEYEVSSDKLFGGVDDSDDNPFENDDTITDEDVKNSRNNDDKDDLSGLI